VKTLLVALDASPRAPVVLATAADLARAAGVRLVLLRAFQVPHEMPAGAWTVAPERVVAAVSARAHSALRELARDLEPTLVLRTVAEPGAPAEVVCRVARDLDVDLIVIGAHGYGVVERMMGTTAAWVVNHADRSVFVVRG
jgi:universal stress protein F